MMKWMLNAAMIIKCRKFRFVKHTYIQTHTHKHTQTHTHTYIQLPNIQSLKLWTCALDRKLFIQRSSYTQFV